VIDSGVTPLADTTGQISERLAMDGGTPDDVLRHPGDALSGHGTFVAAAIASQADGWGSTGLWPRAKIVSVRVFPPDGRPASAADYRAALLACAQPDRQVQVINLSLGGLAASPDELDRLESRVNELRHARGINVVAAAGNSAGAVIYPARFPTALGIGASDGAGVLCAFSNRGEGLDLSAPGCDVEVSLPSGHVAAFWGTSLAAPVASAALAALRAYRPDLTAGQAEDLLLTTARTGTAGRTLDVAAAFRAAGLGHLVDAYRPPHTAPSGTAQAPQPGAPMRDAPTVSVQPAPEAARPRAPRLRQLRHRNGRLTVVVRGVPRDGSAVFRLDGRGYRRAAGILVVRVKRWRRVSVVVEDVWGERSKPLVVSRRR